VLLIKEVEKPFFESIIYSFLNSIACEIGLKLIMFNILQKRQQHKVSNWILIAHL